MSITEEGPNDTARVLLGEDVGRQISGTQSPIFEGVRLGTLIHITIRDKSKISDYTCAIQFGSNHQWRDVKIGDKDISARSVLIDLSEPLGKPALEHYICVIGPTGNIISLKILYPHPDEADQMLSTFRFLD